MIPFNLRKAEDESKVSEFLDQARQRKEREEKSDCARPLKLKGLSRGPGLSASKGEINRPAGGAKCFFFISRAGPARPRPLPIADFAAAQTKSGERKTCAKVQPALSSTSVAKRSSAPGRMTRARRASISPDRKRRP